MCYPYATLSHYLDDRIFGVSLYIFITKQLNMVGRLGIEPRTP